MNTGLQVQKARDKARRGLIALYRGEGVPVEQWVISMYADDARLECAKMYLRREAVEPVAGTRRFSFKGNQAEVDSYIQCVISTLVKR